MAEYKENTSEFYREHIVNSESLFHRIVNDKRIKNKIEIVYKSFWSYHIKFLDNGDTIMLEFTPMVGFQIIKFPSEAENQWQFYNFGFKIDSLIDEISCFCDIAKFNLL